MQSGSNSDASAGATARAAARLDAAITDVFLPDDGRLDDRTRATLRMTLHGLVDAIEGDLRRHGARLLAGRGHADAAAAMLAVEGAALPLLADARLLRDGDLMAELIARTRSDLIAEALPVVVEEPNRPSLLVRLADQRDGVIAPLARALLAADNRRSMVADALPAEVQHRLVWWIAAAVRTGSPPDPVRDEAVVEAARRCLAAYDEGERAEGVAERLVAAIDPLPTELPSLLIEALGDRRLTLFVALVAHALAIEGDAARALVIEPDDDRLWPALRVAGLSRRELARVALSLAEADPRRDIEAFADRLDELVAMLPADARAQLAALSLPRDLRQAERALSRSGR